MFILPATLLEATIHHICAANPGKSSFFECFDAGLFFCSTNQLFYWSSNQLPCTQIYPDDNLNNPSSEFAWHPALKLDVFKVPTAKWTEVRWGGLMNRLDTSSMSDSFVPVDRTASSRRSFGGISLIVLQHIASFCHSVQTCYLLIPGLLQHFRGRGTSLRWPREKYTSHCQCVFVAHLLK